MSLSKCQEVDVLRKKLYVDLPLAKEKIRKEITKLTAALLDIENEERRVKSKLDFNLKAGQTSKCILDIPHVVWSEVRKHLQGHDFPLHNACLSSAYIEEAVNGGLTTKKLRMIGEKVVTVLIKNYYFNDDDQLNFLNTTSLDLQMFAGKTWQCLSERNMSRCSEYMRFEQPDDILLFYKKATQISNKWLLFKGHEFNFDSTKITTVMEYDMFWEAAVSFLEKFGTFILCIIVWFNENFPCKMPLQNYSDLLKIIPNIRYFKFLDQGDIITKINNRTVEPYLSIGGDFVCFQKTAWFESLRQNCVGWPIGAWSMENVQRSDPGFWNSAKELMVYVGYADNDPEDCIELLCADFYNLQNIKKLVFCTDSCSWRCLALLVKFPNATDVELLIKGSPIEIYDDEIYDMNVPKIPFPKVTKLTITSYCMPPTLDIIPMVLPSLRHLRLTLGNTAVPLEEQLKESHEEGRFNDNHIDVCRLLAENQSLKESNIWKEMDNLKEFCLQTQIEISGDVARITGNGWSSHYVISRSEIYTRMKNGSIGFKNIVIFN